jgi:hypothetical protein
LSTGPVPYIPYYWCDGGENATNGQSLAGSMAVAGHFQPQIAEIDNAVKKALTLQHESEITATAETRFQRGR